jgi:CHAT domain-containing protein
MMCLSRFKKLLFRVIASVMAAIIAIASHALPSFSLTALLHETSSTTTLMTAPSNIDAQAQADYAKGNFRSAAQLFTQAAIGYAATNNWLAQALSLGNLSLCYQQLGQWSAAVQPIHQALKLVSNRNSAALAQLLDIEAALLFNRGNPAEALQRWEQVATFTHSEPMRYLSNQIHQSQALQQLGLHRRVIALLSKTLGLPDPQDRQAFLQRLYALPVQPENITILELFAKSLQAIDRPQLAKYILTDSLILAQQQNLPIATLQLTIAQLLQAQGEADSALQLLQTVANQDKGEPGLQALLGQLSLLSKFPKLNLSIPDLLAKITAQLNERPISRITIVARMNLANTLLQLKTSPETILPILQIAQSQAEELGDRRLQADILGTLGAIAEVQQQWQLAADYTSQSVNLAQLLNAPEISYRWQWQLGRILKAQGQIQPAIAAYQSSIATIKSLRADLVGASANLQFSFRDSVEPIHRQLVSLLLQSGQAQDLKIARDVIESLQLVELDNFFREACLTVTPAQIDQVDQTAGVIYPIILEDQLAIISSLPGGNGQPRQIRYHTTPIAPGKFDQTIQLLRSDLAQANASELALPELQKLYDQIIRPIQTDLSNSAVQTLVFVLDGALRNLPMAALYDGQQYLIEKYSIAVTPGLQLLSPKALKQSELAALIVGLDQERPPFAALPFIRQEVSKIQTQLRHRILYNETFTNTEFQTSINSVNYPIVHLATHGQFSGNVDDTFILTWDGKLNANELSSTLQTGELTRQQPLELLILSACETASGDQQSALGLAGVAVRSGARSTIATLWRVNDALSATLMGNFYNELANIKSTGISKAEALRRAQLSIINNPEYRNQLAYWAPYILIGNWI